MNRGARRFIGRGWGNARGRVHCRLSRHELPGSAWGPFSFFYVTPPSWRDRRLDSPQRGSALKIRAGDFFFRQREGVHCALARSYNVLFSIHSVADRAACIGPAKIHVPQRLAGASRATKSPSIPPPNTRPPAVESTPHSVLLTILKSHFFSPVWDRWRGLRRTPLPASCNWPICASPRPPGRRRSTRGQRAATSRNHMAILHARHRPSVAEITLPCAQGPGLPLPEKARSCPRQTDKRGLCAG